MAVENETPPAKVLNFKREPKGTNRMAGDADKSIGDKASTDALIIVCVAWFIVFALAFSLRDFIN